jgi:hypothetical protein
MSKIDEGKLVDALIRIDEYFRAVSDLSLKCSLEITDLLKTTSPDLKKETPEPSKTANWIIKQGQQGQFELLNDKNCEEYRLLKGEVDRCDHPIHRDFAGVPYTVWLMRDGEAIGRKQLRKKP